MFTWSTFSLIHADYFGYNESYCTLAKLHYSIIHIILFYRPYDDDVTNPRAFCSLYPQLTVDGDFSQLIWGPLFMRDVINNARLDFIRVSHVRITMSGFSSVLTGDGQQYYSSLS